MVRVCSSVVVFFYFMNTVQRHFLGWDKPFLPEVAKWLQEHYLSAELGRAKNVLILVSGQEVVRRLQNTLVGNASKEGKKKT